MLKTRRSRTIAGIVATALATTTYLITNRTPQQLLSPTPVKLDMAVRLQGYYDDDGDVDLHDWAVATNAISEAWLLDNPAMHNFQLCQETYLIMVWIPVGCCCDKIYPNTIVQLYAKDWAILGVFFHQSVTGPQ